VDRQTDAQTDAAKTTPARSMRAAKERGSVCERGADPEIHFADVLMILCSAALACYLLLLCKIVITFQCWLHIASFAFAAEC